MNIAFQAFLLLILYLPGELFIQSLTGRFSEEQELPNITAITGLSATALIAAASLNLLWSGVTLLLSWLSALHLKSYAPELWTLLSAAQQSSAYTSAGVRIGSVLGDMAWYFVTLYAFAIGLGLATRQSVKRFRLGARYPLLQFKPQWHYLLSGENTPPRPGHELIVKVDILVELEKKPVIYSGFVSEYWFDKKSHALDVITLEDVVRWPRLTGEKRYDSDSDAEWSITDDVVFVNGDAMAIKMSEIKNINIEYVFNPIA